MSLSIDLFEYINVCHVTLTPTYNNINNVMHMSVYTCIYWFDTANRGGIPPDGTPYTVVRTFYLELVILYYFFACMGILFCTACLIFNFTQRNKRYNVQYMFSYMYTFS